MFLSKRSNENYYLFYNQSNGKRTCVSTKTSNKSKALEFLHTFKMKTDEEIKRGIKQITLKKYVFEFLKYSESVHSWNTTKTFKSTFKIVLAYFGEINLDSISNRDIQKYLEFRIRTGRSVYPARKDLINLSSMFSRAIFDGFVLTNPCLGIKRIKLPEKQPRFFSEEEFQYLLDNIKDNDIKDLVVFAVNTGLRQMELITLEWNQIDIVNRIVLLDNRNVLTKSKKVRSIPLNDRTLEILKRRIELKHQKVFTIEGNQITQKSISNRFRRLMRKLGMRKQLCFHSLRHSFASWLVQKDVPIYVISKLLGHSQISTTEIYTHLRGKDLQSAVDLI